MNLRRLVVLAAGYAAALPACAIGCDDLQQTIEARIRANGVPRFTVTAVDAAASAPGQVVGTCDGGRKKLLYVRGAVAPATAPAASAPAATASDPVRTSSPAVITECADGRVITDGSCKK